MKNNRDTIGMLGAGVLGGTLLRTWLEDGICNHKSCWATTLSKNSAEKVKAQLKIPVSSQLDAKLLSSTSLLFLAVKPAQVRGLLESMKKHKLSKSCVVVSLATGVSTRTIESYLPSKQPVIRVITNTPAQVRSAVTAIVPGNSASKSDVAKVEALFSRIGSTTIVDEKFSDTFTGLTASGPAFLYLILEALADGAVKMGISRKDAIPLVAQTMKGAAEMVLKTGLHPAVLKDDVTTPSGCTISGLFVMEDGKIRSILARAVEEASKRASELGG